MLSSPPRGGTKAAPGLLQQGGHDGGDDDDVGSGGGCDDGGDGNEDGGGGGDVRGSTFGLNSFLNENDSATAPPKTTPLFSFMNVSWLLNTRKDAMKKYIYIHKISCWQRTIERWRRGGKGHRL